MASSKSRCSDVGRTICRMRGEHGKRWLFNVSFDGLRQHAGAYCNNKFVNRTADEFASLSFYRDLMIYGCSSFLVFWRG